MITREDWSYNPNLGGDPYRKRLLGNLRKAPRKKHCFAFADLYQSQRDVRQPTAPVSSSLNAGFPPPPTFLESEFRSVVASLRKHRDVLQKPSRPSLWHSPKIVVEVRGFLSYKVSAVVIMTRHTIPALEGKVP